MTQLFNLGFDANRGLFACVSPPFVSLLYDAVITTSIDYALNNMYTSSEALQTLSSGFAILGKDSDENGGV